MRKENQTNAFLTASSKSLQANVQHYTSRGNACVVLCPLYGLPLSEQLLVIVQLYAIVKQ